MNDLNFRVLRMLPIKRTPFLMCVIAGVVMLCSSHAMAEPGPIEWLGRQFSAETFPCGGEWTASEGTAICEQLEGSEPFLYVILGVDSDGIISSINLFTPLNQVTSEDFEQMRVSLEETCPEAAYSELSSDAVALSADPCGMGYTLSLVYNMTEAQFWLSYETPGRGIAAPPESPAAAADQKHF